MPFAHRKPTPDTLTYDIVPSALGYVLIAATARGARYLTIRQDRSALRQAIEDYVQLSGVDAESGSLPLYSRPLAAYLNGDARELSFPVDVVEGTPFQRNVWKVMRTIPYGQTLTYKELAEKAGAPNAVRAVGTACGANPLALYYPCHRVLRSGGGLGGYSGGGLEVKKALLAMEARQA